MRKRYAGDFDPATLVIELCSYSSVAEKLSKALALLVAADCPQCKDKSGAYYDNYGEVCQCQWCNEVYHLTTQP